MPPFSPLFVRICLRSDLFEGHFFGIDLALDLYIGGESLFRCGDPGGYRLVILFHLFPFIPVTRYLLLRFFGDQVRGLAYRLAGVLGELVQRRRHLQLRDLRFELFQTFYRVYYPELPIHRDINHDVSGSGYLGLIGLIKSPGGDRIVKVFKNVFLGTPGLALFLFGFCFSRRRGGLCRLPYFSGLDGLRTSRTSCTRSLDLSRRLCLLELFQLGQGNFPLLVGIFYPVPYFFNPCLECLGSRAVSLIGDAGGICRPLHVAILLCDMNAKAEPIGGICYPDLPFPPRCLAKGNDDLFRVFIDTIVIDVMSFSPVFRDRFI